jgi:FK506-binding nuclear protein
LTGNYVGKSTFLDPLRLDTHKNYGNLDQSPPDNVPFNYDSEDSDEDAYDLREVSSDAEVDINDLDGFDDEYVEPLQTRSSLSNVYSRFEEVVENEPKSLKRPREDAMETSATEGKLSKAEKKKMKKLKAENGEAVATSTDSPKTSSEPKKEKASEPKKEKSKPAGETKEIAGGLIVQDVKTGTGPQAKKGSTVSMRYIGKLQGPGGKVFDKNTKGKPVSRS